jgi:hypothetical protein
MENTWRHHTSVKVLGQRPPVRLVQEEKRELKLMFRTCLRKLENHTNALAVNLLDNSETTRRLKRYTVPTLPDRPE